MTQNKKKGIAKKALSVSLVAAMLATSNVPAWASGFEAVDPAEGFAVEAAAPEAAENNATLLGDVFENSDINAEISIPETAKIGDIITPDITITDKNGTEINGYKYVWREVGTTEAIAEGALGVTKDHLGMTLEVYVYHQDGVSYNYSAVSTTKMTIVPQEVSDSNFTMTILGTYLPGYIGKAYTTEDVLPAIESISYQAPTGEVKFTGTQITDNFNITTNSATNYGETLIVTATAKEDSGYEGSVTAEIPIYQREYEAGFLEATVNAGVEYEYTGANITMDPADVTVKEKADEDKNFYGTATISTDAIHGVLVDGTSVGEKTANVYVNPEKLTNFKGIADNELTTTNKVKIAPRDLSDVTITLGKNNEVLNTSAPKDITVKFTDGATVVNLVKGQDYTLTVKDTENPAKTYGDNEKLSKVGTYTATINWKGENTIGSQNVTFEVSDNRIETAEGSKFNNYSVDYTGSAITPGKEEIGDLTVDGEKGESTLSSNEWEISGWENNINASNRGSNHDKAYVVIKILKGTYKDKTVKLGFTINPLTVSEDDVTVPETTLYDKYAKDAADYEVPVTVVARNSKDEAYTVPVDAYTVKYEYVGANKNKLGNKIKATVTLNEKENGNFTTNDTLTAETELVARRLEDSFIIVDPDTYTYTGGKIVPSYTVMDGTRALEEGVDYKEIAIGSAVEVGTGTITIEGLGDYYSGKATATFTITPASIDDVKVEVIDKFTYTGKGLRPHEDDIKVTLNGNDVTDQFTITAYGENKNAGEDAGSLTLAVRQDTDNFVAGSKTVTFDIKPAEVNGTLTVYDANGSKYTLDSGNHYYYKDGTPVVFEYDGTAKTFASEKLENLTAAGFSAKDIPADDFEIIYADNTYGKSDGSRENTAYVYAVAKEGSNFAGPENSTITLADGTVIKNVVAYGMFKIGALHFDATNVSVKNGTYAEGLLVKPEVTVQFGGNTLVEGQDYKLTCDSATEVTLNKPYDVTITGINGYSGSTVKSDTTNSANKCSRWGIDKKDLADCDITVADGVVTAMNGTVVIPGAKLDVTENADGTYTIKPSATGAKQYTGSVTVADSVPEVPETPASTVLSVADRTTSTVTVNWDKVDGAEGYTIWYRSEYDTEMSRKIIFDGDETSWTLKGLQPGTKYFFAMRSWVKDAEGNYIFSDVSPTQRGTTKPLAAKIIGVSVENGKIKVRLAGEAAGAEMYSMCYGDARTSFADNDFKVGIRTQYTTRTLTPTFEPGTYYVCVKSYRDLGNNKRVYGAWSNTFRAVVK